MAHCRVLLIRSFLNTDPQLQPLHANILKCKTANQCDDRLNVSEPQQLHMGCRTKRIALTTMKIPGVNESDL